MRRVVVLLLPVLLAACGDGEPGTTSPPIQAIAIGEKLPDGIRRSIRSPDGHWSDNIDIAQRCGRVATVFYGWSVACPCVESVESRMQALIKLFGPMRGVQWLAIAGEPLDTREQYREKLLRMDAKYALAEDPDQVLCRFLSIDAACVVAVLDAERKLVYRGPIDEDYVKGKGAHLRSVLRAVLNKTPVSPSTRERTYGCVFNDPASCVQRRGPQK